jgi:hypothetical protein
LCTIGIIGNFPVKTRPISRYHTDISSIIYGTAGTQENFFNILSAIPPDILYLALPKALLIKLSLPGRFNELDYINGRVAVGGRCRFGSRRFGSGLRYKAVAVAAFRASCARAYRQASAADIA